jgi:hypothetical protein
VATVDAGVDSVDFEDFGLVFTDIALAFGEVAGLVATTGWVRVWTRAAT